MPRIRLPQEPYRLEEVNMPETLARQLAGKTVTVKVVPKELPGTRKLKMGETPAMIAPDGTVWNVYRPTSVSFRDSEGRTWNLPRFWQSGPQDSAEPIVEGASQIFQERQFLETLHLPSTWDLQDINIPQAEAERAGGRPTQVLVQLKPGEQVRVYWKDSSEMDWRVPHDWRRRRVRLPRLEVLVAQGLPEEVARRFSEAVVSVNYHPGSLCCLLDGYRFRDEQGNRWPVKKQDCLVLGFGNGITGSV